MAHRKLTTGHNHHHGPSNRVVKNFCLTVFHYFWNKVLLQYGNWSNLVYLERELKIFNLIGHGALVSLFAKIYDYLRSHYTLCLIKSLHRWLHGPCRDSRVVVIPFSHPSSRKNKLFSTTSHMDCGGLNELSSGSAVGSLFWEV